MGKAGKLKNGEVVIAIFDENHTNYDVYEATKTYVKNYLSDYKSNVRLEENSHNLLPLTDKVLCVFGTYTDINDRIKNFTFHLHFE